MTSGTLADAGAKVVVFQPGASNGQAEPARSVASGRMDEQPDAVAFPETNLSPPPLLPTQQQEPCGADLHMQLRAPLPCTGYSNQQPPLAPLGHLPQNSPSSFSSSSSLTEVIHSWTDDSPEIPCCILGFQLCLARRGDHAPLSRERISGQSGFCCQKSF